MDRDHEIDDLRKTVAEIREMLENSMYDQKKERVYKMSQEEHVQKMPGMHDDPNMMAILDRLEDSCNEDGSSGRLAYLGVFASGGRQSTWLRHDVNTDKLLNLIEEGTAEKVLACIGSKDRLNLLLAILRAPRTVAQMVGGCGFTSTGQVYHHLKPLIAADLVAEDEHIRGTYVIVPHRVQGIMMLLAGISDMIDPEYSQGEL